VTWPDIVPNLLIGLREGLEAGLVVSILLAAVRKAGLGLEESAPDGRGRKISAAPIWLGVLAAVMLSGSFAAVLTFSTDALSSRAQEAVGGLLSVLAVALVTAMIFWMRRTAAGMTAQLRGEVARATAIGAGALTITAFLAVGREGLETTLFLWTTARASGQTLGPLVGAAAGLAAAVVLCWLLYRRAVRLNVGAFFNRTAVALIVIAAGVLAYGLGELQQASLLAGQRWIAFDLTAHAQPGSWWVSLITGVTDLSPKMTVLQVVAWIAYVGVVIPAFAKAGRSVGAHAASTSRAAVAAPASASTASQSTAPGSTASESAPAASTSAAGTAVTGIARRWERLAGRRPWAVAGVLVVIPAVVAGATIAALPAASSASVTTVTVTRTACAPNWTSAAAGTQTFTVDNQSGLPGEINLDDTSGDIVAEIETIGPATSAQLTATLSNGTYVFKCFMGALAATASQPVQVTGGSNSSATSRSANSPIAAGPIAVKPVTVAELTGPNKKYQAYAAVQLAQLTQAVSRIQADLRSSDVAAAKADWLNAQLDWERVGASYDSFGNLGLAVDGLPDGLPGGVNSQNFSGLHRLEYGLWHGQSAASLVPVAETLARNVATVQRDLTSDDLAGDPTNLPIRAHEILEDALRDHLSGIDDQGSGAAFAETDADLQVAGAVLGYLTPLLNARQPGLPSIADGQLAILKQALLATQVNGQWESLATAPLSAREQVDSAIGAALETLSTVPDLLEVPPTH
jgi:high-affinity iron transporter